MPAILRRAWRHEELATLDECLFGETFKFFQEREQICNHSSLSYSLPILAHTSVQDAMLDPSPISEFWKERDILCELRPEREDKASSRLRFAVRSRSAGIASSPTALAPQVVPPPIHLVTGWHDFFLKSGLASFELASKLNPDCKLTVGCHGHFGQLLLPNLQILYRALLTTLDAKMPLGHLASVSGDAEAGSPQRPLRALPSLRAGYMQRGTAEKAPLLTRQVIEFGLEVLNSVGLRSAAARAIEVKGEDDAVDAEELELPIQIRYLGSMRWGDAHSLPA